MQTGQFSHEQIIEFAANFEQRGVKLYTAAAHKVKQEPARNLLLHLAAQEKEHEEYFRQLTKELKNNNKPVPHDMDDEAVGYLGALVEGDIFPDNDHNFADQIHTLQDVIKAGKQAEKDSILFYLELARFAWDEDSKKILLRITQEEKKHLVQLQELDKLIEERDVYY